MFYNALLTGLV